MKKSPLGPATIKAKQDDVMHEFIHKRDTVFARFPLLFTLLGTFGLVATSYGFQHLIDRVHVLSRNPLILLATGLLTLIFIGQLYKKLD